MKIWSLIHAYTKPRTSPHNTFKRILQKIKMWFLQHKKLVIHVWKLQLHFPSGVTFVLLMFFCKSHIIKNIYKHESLTWRLVTTFPEENGFWNKTIKNADLLKEESFLNQGICSQLFIQTSSKPCLSYLSLLTRWLSLRFSLEDHNYHPHWFYSPWCVTCSRLSG